MRVLMLLVAGCASAGQLAESPFTAEEIRGATQAGRTYVWRIGAEGKTFLRRLKFTEVDDAKATTEAINLSEDGAPMGEAEVKTTTWPELVSHASWPKEFTTITDDRITVGAGEYDCMLYTVDEKKDGKGMRTRAWFAKSLPGAPVKLVVEVDGREVSTLELIEHQPGQ